MFLTNGEKIHFILISLALKESLIFLYSFYHHVLTSHFLVNSTQYDFLSYYSVAILLQRKPVTFRLQNQYPFLSTQNMCFSVGFIVADCSLFISAMFFQLLIHCFSSAFMNSLIFMIISLDFSNFSVGLTSIVSLASFCNLFVSFN